jgi:hypothetical protein
MLTKNVTTGAVAGLAIFVAANVASANDFSLNAKEVNGRSSYIGVAHSSGDLGNINFVEAQPSFNQVDNFRNGKKIKFDDADGIIGTIGNDYGYVRLETEFGYRKADVKEMTGVANAKYTEVKGKANIGTAMVNLAIEYTVDPSEFTGGATSGITVTPFITAGGGVTGVHGNLGYKRIDLTTTKEEIDEGFFMAPTIQGGAGLTLGLPFGVEVFGQYTEMLAYTYDFKGSNDIHIQSVTGGLRLNF